MSHPLIIVRPVIQDDAPHEVKGTRRPPGRRDGSGLPASPPEDSPHAAPPDDYSSFSSDSLAACVGQLHGISNAALREIFRIVAELHRRDAFHDEGVRDGAAWLTMRLGISAPKAKRWADTALALEELPHIAEAFSSGELCLDKTVLAAEMATPETDERVAKEARDMRVPALAIKARQKRNVDPDAEVQARKRRGLSWRWPDGGAAFSISGRLTAEQGSALVAAIDRTAERLPFEDEDGEISMYQKRADALAALAELQIAEDPDPARADVVVHVSLEALRSGVGGGYTDQGAIFSTDVMQRLTCDSRIQLLVEDGDLKPVGIGRNDRTIPPWLRRVLEVRDTSCRFPGCNSTLFLQGHHHDFWTRDLGPTNEDNLSLLCSFHHKLIHKPGWRIEGNPRGELVFVRPDGQVVRDGPPPLDYDVKKWLWEDMYKPSTGSLLDTS